MRSLTLLWNFKLFFSTFTATRREHGKSNNYTYYIYIPKYSHHKLFAAAKIHIYLETEKKYLVLLYFIPLFSKCE
jgi:hypothetical protein